MKNNFKKISIIIIVTIILFTFLSFIEYHIYTLNFNNKVVELISLIKEDYPNVSEKEIIDILNNTNEVDIDLSKYGIDISKDSIILSNTNSFYTFLIINIVFILVIICLVVYIFYKYNKKLDDNLSDITKYIKEINNRNYKLDINKMDEGELSILKSEIYKTTVMLRELADNSINDKIMLKEYLEDITHQLKTPLTSILIMLDNILNDKDMAENVRNDFLESIKREILNINTLVKTLLTLAKLDACSITLNKKKVKVSYIIEESIKNVAILCDLKNIQIEVTYQEDALINVDAMWEIEALTNIVKNATEHSYQNCVIEINVSSNKVYSLIEIKNYGDYIKKEDLPHIFERFYKTNNTSGVGIGLNLSKSIIEKDNGKISVESKEQEYTIFKIKYYK